MFIILVLFIGLAVLRSDLKQLSQVDRYKVFGMLIVYFCAMIYYVSYINDQPRAFGYGIPGADMLAHYKGAEAMAKGASWSKLATIATRFESIGISTIGYFLYTSFVSLCIFFLPIFPTGVNVYLVYVFQILVSLDACLRFAILVSPEFKSTKAIRVFAMLALCVPYMVQAFQLMRDIYTMWVIVSLLLMVSRSRKRCLPGNNVDAKTGYYLKIGGLLVLSVLLRFYSVVLTVPLMLYYSDKKKMAVYAVLAEIGVLLLGTNLVDLVKNLIGLPWSITPPNPKESVNFLLFPNIVNQSKYLWHWKHYFGTRIDSGGCNVPGVYYAMAVWNIWVLPLAIVGIITQWKEKKDEILVWTGILLSVVLIYSITYDAIDTRHKFFMSLSMCYLAIKGTEALKKWVPLFLYNMTMLCAVTVILLMGI